MTWRAAFLAVVVLALAPAAHAGTVSVSRGALTVTGAFGEASSLAAEHSEQGFFSVRDTAAPPTAGPGCQQFRPDEVLCPDGGVTTVVLDLGDGNDAGYVQNVADVPGLDVTIHGGTGNDTLVGSGHGFGDDGEDKLYADELADAILDGGAGDDDLHSGP